MSDFAIYISMINVEMQRVIQYQVRATYSMTYNHSRQIIRVYQSNTSLSVNIIDLINSE